jgi:Excreted virulence factor EspC, type VII ESX diderm
MSFEVIIEDLRKAAGDLDSMVAPLAGYSLGAPKADAEAVGHVELAAWLVAVLEQADKAGAALHDGAGALADRLRGAAHYYEDSDGAALQRFRSPFGPGLPGGPTPFGQGPFIGPVVPTPGSGGDPR